MTAESPSDKPDENEVLHQGKLIALHKERVELPSGGHTYFDIVKHPGGSVVAAIDHKNQVCLLKQWRHAINREIWELPAGCLEEGEPALETAKRELEEETGVIAKQWKELGTITTSPGFSNEILYLYQATDLSLGTVKLDDAEQLEAHWFDFQTVLKMARNGDIIDGKTLALLLRLELSIEQDD